MLMAAVDAPAPRRRRLPVVNGELLAEGITALNRAGNITNQIARELNQQKFQPDGGLFARALRGGWRCPACAAEVKSPTARFCTKCGCALSGKLAAQDNGAVLAVEALRQVLEPACAKLENAADAIIYAAGYNDVRRR
jgi:hypothetical protein